MYRWEIPADGRALNVRHILFKFLTEEMYFNCGYCCVSLVNVQCEHNIQLMAYVYFGKKNRRKWI